MGPEPSARMQSTNHAGSNLKNNNSRMQCRTLLLKYELVSHDGASVNISVV